jgi:leader peptidase (prepilin peptidase)/N-methyltransferase
MLTGFMLVLAYLRMGWSVDFLAATILLSVLIVAVFTDLLTGLIPDRLSLSLGLAGMVLAFVGGMEQVEEALLGAVVGGGLLYLTGWLGQWIFKRESMGGGDVKLVAGMGLFLGVSGILDGLIWACGMGALVGIVLRLSGRLEAYAEVPFAPFLALGAGIHLLSGIELLEFLMNT